MKQTKTITIPESLDDITVRQLAQYMASDLSTEDKAAESALRIFVGIDLETQKKASRSDLSSVSKRLIDVLNQRPTLKTKFKYAGKTWGFVPNIEDIPSGEYIDLDTYIGDWATMHKALAVAYRPIVDEGKGWYEIEPYAGSDKYAGLLQDAPASIAVGLMLFFWTIGTQLLNDTLKRLQVAEKDAGLMPDLSSLVDGDGILPYSTWRGETFWYLTKLLSYRFTPS